MAKQKQVQLNPADAIPVYRCTGTICGHILEEVTPK